jgi:hypothetical protein
MKLTRSALYTRGLAVMVLAAAALGIGNAAHARGDVYWNIGVEAAPGVNIGVGNARPIYVAPAPVYVAPAPVYYAAPPVYYAPAPVYYGTTVYYGPRHRHHHKRGHKHWRRH